MNSPSWGERASTVVRVFNMHFLVNFGGTLLMILSISVFFNSNSNWFVFTQAAVIISYSSNISCKSSPLWAEALTCVGCGFSDSWITPVVQFLRKWFDPGALVLVSYVTCVGALLTLRDQLEWTWHLMKIINSSRQSDTELFWHFVFQGTELCFLCRQGTEGIVPRSTCTLPHHPPACLSPLLTSSQWLQSQKCVGKVIICFS